MKNQVKLIYKAEKKEETKSNKKDRCPNCKKEFYQNEMFDHSLKCLRKQRTCKICKELISEDQKQEHLNDWRSHEVIFV